MATSHKDIIYFLGPTYDPLEIGTDLVCIIVVEVIRTNLHRFINI